MARYVRWRTEGYLSSNGTCFDIGNTVARALRRFQQTGEPYSGSTDPYTAGNGSIMRLAPVPMMYVEDLGRVAHYSAESSRTTHGTGEAVDACRLLGVMIALALRGESKEVILFHTQGRKPSLGALATSIKAIARGSYKDKERGAIRGTGYVAESLEAALWCLWRTNSYREAILQAANLGDDADTTAAVCGQLAGAHYGIEGIPGGWLDKLAKRRYIESIASELYERRQRA